MENVIHVISNDEEIGMIIKAAYHGEGISFLSDNDAYLQLGYMNHPTDYVIVPHIHNRVERKVYLTEEILFIRNGKVRVDFYDDTRRYLKSYFTYAGDIVVLKKGGHGFKFYENSEIFEVKQGPYLQENDKIRYEPVDDSLVIIDLADV